MKISLNWLRDYIDLNGLTIQEISDLLTDIGLEVEGFDEVESIKGGLKGLVVGEVKTCDQHPDADRLKLCTVDLGSGEPVQIVCGAPNVAVGQKVIVAPVGTTIYPTNGDSFQIKKAKIRGQESSGMLCSEDEVGLGTSHDGIKVLSNKAKVGQPVTELYEVFEDTVFEIGLTPNRSDAQSHIGVARDLVAAINTQLKKPVSLKWPSTTPFAVDDESTPIEVVLENPEACPRYAGLVISNITIKESPDWLRNRLRAIGVKPINNVVDVTNYINHEYGQPLHAFDYSKISGNKIIVKNLKSGTKFTTLDGVERSLSDQDLMICNQNEPMCIAGVYGGLESGVKDSTTAIFLESAYFDPQTIRRTELRHNLRTDAATKFEKGVDPTKQVEILRRAALMIQELAGGTFSSKMIDLYPNPIERKMVKLSFDRLNQMTGIDFEPLDALEILKLLDFQVIQKSDLFVHLSVPQYRSDVYREADVIEEVLRIYGFNNVPVHNEARFELSFKESHQDNLRNNLSNLLSGKGFNELITNSITRKSYYERIGADLTSAVKPLNSINTSLDLLRPDMVMSGLEVLEYNINRSISNIKAYDFGKIYAHHKGKYQEYNRLSIYITGQKNELNWLEDEKETDFFDAKRVVNELLLKSGIRQVKQQETANESLSYGLDFLVGKQVVASVGAIKQSIIDLFNLKQQVYFASLDFDFLIQQQPIEVKFKPISKYPVVNRELALVLDQNVTYQQVEDIAKKQGGKNLQNVRLFNVYDDESKLGKGKKSYAIGLTFQNTEDTLTSDAVDHDMQKLMNQFEKQLNAVIRR